MVSDYVIELGPGGGANGGEIIAEGTIGKVLKSPKSIIKNYVN